MDAGQYDVAYTLGVGFSGWHASGDLGFGVAFGFLIAFASVGLDDGVKNTSVSRVA